MAALDRRRVTHKSVQLASDGTLLTFEKVDYVAVEDLDAYLNVARSHWQSVTVSDEEDHGPAGPDGAYTTPDALTGA